MGDDELCDSDEELSNRIDELSGRVDELSEQVDDLGRRSYIAGYTWERSWQSFCHGLEMQVSCGAFFTECSVGSTLFTSP
jgi:hypothetical protein